MRQNRLTDKHALRNKLNILYKDLNSGVHTSPSDVRGPTMGQMLLVKRITEMDWPGVLR